MEIERPTELSSALRALAERPEATIVAGGTDLMVPVNGGRHRPEAVVAVRRVAELQEWDDGFIGAGVTYRRLETSAHTALAQLARTVGSPQIRNAGTIGGNLGTASPAGDALPWLAAVDADIVLRSTEGGTRTIPWHAFLQGPKRTARAPGELILGVRLPTPPPERQAFAKVGTRSAMVISMVSAVVTLADDGRVTVALGSVGPTTLRAPEAEAVAAGLGRADAAGLAEFERRVRDAVTPIDDHRATADYRRHAAGVLARRLLERVLA